MEERSSPRTVRGQKASRFMQMAMSSFLPPALPVSRVLYDPMVIASDPPVKRHR